jgi:hypothetical protein
MAYIPGLTKFARQSGKMTIVVVTSSIMAVADEIKIFHNIGFPLFGEGDVKARPAHIPR